MATIRTATDDLDRMTNLFRCKNGHDYCADEWSECPLCRLQLEVKRLREEVEAATEVRNIMARSHDLEVKRLREALKKSSKYVAHSAKHPHGAKARLVLNELNKLLGPTP